MENTYSSPKNFCPNCGKKLHSDSQKFCVYCGNKLYKTNYISEEKNTDPFLSKNIVLIGFALLLSFFTVIISIYCVNSENTQKSLDPASATVIFCEIIYTVMIYSATKPSSDHVDSTHMKTLKEIEMIIAYIPIFIITIINIGYQFMFVALVSGLISIVLPAIYIIKCRKIVPKNRNTRQNVLFALSIIFAVLTCLTIFCTFIELINL